MRYSSTLAALFLSSALCLVGCGDSGGGGGGGGGAMDAGSGGGGGGGGAMDAGSGGGGGGGGAMDAGSGGGGGGGAMDAGSGGGGGSPSCAGACDACFSAVQAACATCPTDMDCDTPADRCASAVMLQGMVGCTGCAAAANTAICD